MNDRTMLKEALEDLSKEHQVMNWIVFDDTPRFKILAANHVSMAGLCRRLTTLGYTCMCYPHKGVKDTTVWVFTRPRGELEVQEDLFTSCTHPTEMLKQKETAARKRKGSLLDEDTWEARVAGSLNKHQAQINKLFAALRNNGINPDAIST